MFLETAHNWMIKRNLLMTEDNFHYYSECITDQKLRFSKILSSLLNFNNYFTPAGILRICSAIRILFVCKLIFLVRKPISATRTADWGF